MKEILIFLPVLGLFFALKGAVFSSIPVPDLPLLSVFYLAARRPTIESALFAFLIGFIDDAFDGGVIGTTSFTLIAAFLLTHLLSKKVQFITPGVKAAGAGAACLVKGVLTYVVMRFAGRDVQFLFDVVILCAVTAAFAPAALAFFSRVSSYAAPRSFKDNEN